MHLTFTSHAIKQKKLDSLAKIPFVKHKLDMQFKPKYTKY